MNNAQNNTVFVSTPPAAIVDNATLTSNVIDTLGYDYCEILVIKGATDIADVACKVQESDVKSNTTALTSGADVAGLVYGTSTNIAGTTSALPSSTADNTVTKFEIDLKGRKRYLLPVVTHGDGAAGGFSTIIALLSKAEVQPNTAAARGYGDILRV
jgi:hypothetical protein